MINGITLVIRGLATASGLTTFERALFLRETGDKPAGLSDTTDARLVRDATTDAGLMPADVTVVTTLAAAFDSERPVALVGAGAAVVLARSGVGYATLAAGSEDSAE